MAKVRPPAPPGKRWVYRRWVRNPKTGARIYPRGGKCFVFLVDE